MNYKKIGAFLIFTLFAVVGYSQNTINSYKYVILPKKFAFLSSMDEYALNSTTKSLLEQKGFTVYWENGDLPLALASNRCGALMAEVTQRKAMFTTNLTLSLKDCYGNIIFKGKEGRSWEKEFGVAYAEALKNAFASLNTVSYKYDSTLAVQTQQPANASAANTSAAAASTATATAASAPPVAAASTPPTTAAPTTTASVPPIVAASTPPATAGSSQLSTSPQQVSAPAKPVATDASGALYAQAIPNGYQLIDTTPKKIMTLLKTSIENFFLASDAAGTANGIVFKRDTEWFFEYYKNGTLVSQKLTIKF